MRNALYLLLMSLFVLAGCNNQSLESTEQSVSRTQQVKISLGDDFSSRSQRYKGNYDDVTNGGSVVLYYAFQSADNTTVELSSNMSPSGGDWTVDLTLATGEYTFRAEAFNSGKVKIFDTDTARTFQITTATTSFILLRDVSWTVSPLLWRPLPTNFVLLACVVSHLLPSTHRAGPTVAARILEAPLVSSTGVV